MNEQRLMTASFEEIDSLANGDESISSEVLKVENRPYNINYEKHWTFQQRKESVERATSNGVLVACPFCGGTKGFYDKWTLYRHNFYAWGGKQDGYVDSATGKGGMRKYCRNCDRIIDSVIDEHHRITK